MSEQFRFSLHKNRKPRECDICGDLIPVREPPDYAEYWRVKGRSPDGAPVPRVICCLCHVLFGLPEDGWEHAADGYATSIALTPFRQGGEGFQK